MPQLHQRHAAAGAPLGHPVGASRQPRPGPLQHLRRRHRHRQSGRLLRPLPQADLLLRPEKAGYSPDPKLHAPDQEGAGLPLIWDIDYRDYLIREMKEQAWNVQQGKCGQCHEELVDIARSSIVNSPAGPMLICDEPCAARAMGRENPLPHGSYPTDPIVIVAAPRHGVPQDWLNVHFELSLPDRSDEVWSKADCRFGVELYADPERYEFFAEWVLWHFAGGD